MTIREAFIKGTEMLKKSGIETPVADAGVMLCNAAGCDRAYIYAHGDDTLESHSDEIYAIFLAKRCSGMPVQYIVGKQEFMSLDFHIENGVLIPRQDTEILTEAVIEHCKHYKGIIKILEIGTGSGCIAVSIAKYISNCFVVATDISSKALEIASFNAHKNKVNNKIHFIKSNLFSGINMGCFDVIVSNPPYISTEEISTLQREVRDYEPLQALDGGLDGLDYYRNITGEAPGRLKKNGLVAFEVGIGQAIAVAGLMRRYFQDISIVKDLSGIDRVVKGYQKGTFLRY
jgi:protein-(glutamine-N5) methyltransferase, release factor-specific